MLDVFKKILIKKKEDKPVTVIDHYEPAHALSPDDLLSCPTDSILEQDSQVDISLYLCATRCRNVLTQLGLGSGICSTIIDYIGDNDRINHSTVTYSKVMNDVLKLLAHTYTSLDGRLRTRHFTYVINKQTPTTMLKYLAKLLQEKSDALPEDVNFYTVKQLSTLERIQVSLDILENNHDIVEEIGSDAGVYINDVYLDLLDATYFLVVKGTHALNTKQLAAFKQLMILKYGSLKNLNEHVTERTNNLSNLFKLHNLENPVLWKS